MMVIDPTDARWGWQRADCKVFAPRNREEMHEAASDCGFSVREATEIVNAFGVSASLPADPPTSRVEPAGELLRILQMFALGED